MQPDEKRALWYLRKIPLLQDVSQDTFQKLLKVVELREIRRRRSRWRIRFPPRSRARRRSRWIPGSASGISTRGKFPRNVIFPRR